MNIEQIVQVAVSVFTPAFPYLVKGAKAFGDKFANTFGEKSGELSAKTIQTAWETILSREGASVDKIESSAEQLAKNPQDTDWQSMLKRGLTQLLKEDQSLVKELSKLLKVEVGEQYILARNNIDAVVNQQMIGNGTQETVLEDNIGVTITQNKK